MMAIIIFSNAKTILKDDHQTNIGTCQVSNDVMPSEQFDWCHPVFSGTNIFLHGFHRPTLCVSGTRDFVCGRFSISIIYTSIIDIYPGTKWMTILF